MTHNHNHDHNHGGHGHHHHGSRRSLFLSFTITLSFMVVEAVGGWLSNSLALLSDAGHMLTDASALGLSLLALKMGERPPSVTKTFGYRRFEILAALLNGLALWAIVGVIFREAYHRFQKPPEVEAVGMIAIAAIGLSVNLVSLYLLHAHKDENLNIRGAFLHVMADSLGSVGALVAGVIILKTGWTLVDPLVSLGICALILWSSWGLIKDAVHILLLGVPAHIAYHEVEEEVSRHEGVCCLYDLHVWSIASGHDAMSVHVVVPDGFTGKNELLQNIVDGLRERFGIGHATIQIEETHNLRDERIASVCKVGGGSVACAYPADETAAKNV